MSGTPVEKIKSWVKETLHTEGPPAFEENAETLSILEQMMKQHQESKKFTELFSKLAEHEILEYSVETLHLKHILSTLSMDPSKDCSAKTLQYIKVLSQVSLCLGNSHPSITNMAIAMSGFGERQEKTKMARKHSEQIMQQMQSELSDIQSTKAHLQRQLDELESSLPVERKNVESLQRSMHFLTQKKKDYQKQIVECEKVLKESGFTNDISHGELVKLGQEAQKLEETIKPFKLHLDSYKVLPPNLDHAKLKLNEKLAEVKSVEEEVQDSLRHLTLTP